MYFLICPRIFIKFIQQPNSYLLYVKLQFVLYTTSLVFVPQKDFHYVHNNIDLFFVFIFFLFFLKILIFFRCFLWESFFLFSGNFFKKYFISCFICFKDQFHCMSYVSYMSYINYMSYVPYMSYTSFMSCIFS